jgi:hypothetical protein
MSLLTAVEVLLCLLLQAKQKSNIKTEAGMFNIFTVVIFELNNPAPDMKNIGYRKYKYKRKVL